MKRNKWTALSKEYSDALVEYAAIIRPAESSDKMPALIDRYIAEAAPTLAENSAKLYRGIADRLKKVFSEMYPHQVKPIHVAQLLDKYRDHPAKANAARNVLKQVFSKAVLWGMTETNPVQFVPRLRMTARDRYLTDTEFKTIHERASPTMRAIMDILYLTGQRIGDVLSIRHADIEPDGVFFRQQKTKNRLKVIMSDDLRAAIATARRLHQSVKGMTLFHTRQGSKLTYSTVLELWRRATNAAGVENANIHDIRAKAATDAKAQGLDSKKLLGHSSESAHMRYLRSKEIPIAQPVKLKKS